MYQHSGRTAGRRQFVRIPAPDRKPVKSDRATGTTTLSCKANKVNPLTYLTYVLANARNKSIPLPTPDVFTVSNIAHVG